MSCFGQPYLEKILSCVSYQETYQNHLTFLSLSHNQSSSPKMSILSTIPVPPPKENCVTTKPHLLLPLLVLFKHIGIWPPQQIGDCPGGLLQPPLLNSEPAHNSSQISAALPVVVMSVHQEIHGQRRPNTYHPWLPSACVKSNLCLTQHLFLFLTSPLKSSHLALGVARCQ